MIYRAEENASTGQIEAQPYAGMVETTPAPDALCTTAAVTAAKLANAPGYTLRTGNRFTMMLANANSAQSALTLNVNGTGAKPIYINGAASSSSNYTLPAGDYEVLYDGTNYQIRTDLSVAGTIAIGNGGTGATVALGARQNLGVADASNLAPTEATRTMSAQRTAGSYVYVTADDQFYQITTTIAANGTLTPGTNATAKSIADVLVALNSDLASTNTTVNTLSLKAGNNAGTGYQTYGVGDSLADTVTSTVIPWIKRDGSTESGVFGWMWLQHGYYITIYAYLWEGSNKILMLLTKSSSGQTFEDSRTVAA